MHHRTSAAEAERLLLILWLTSGLTALGAGCVAWMAYVSTAPLSIDAALLHQLTVSASNFTCPEQPKKNAAFVAGCLAAAPLFGLNYLAVVWLAGWMGERRTRLLLYAAPVLTWGFVAYAMQTDFFTARAPVPGIPPPAFYLIHSH